MERIFPRIGTFYSFKGGVGRSMAVLNVAWILASWGRRVLLLDMDLEAPGLSTFLHRKVSLGAQPQGDILDLLSWAIAEADADPQERDAASWGPPIYHYARRVPEDALTRPPLGEMGRVDVIGACEGPEHFDRLERLALASMDRDKLAAVSRVLRRYLLTRLLDIEMPDYYGPEAETRLPYDYVLVDSRTGITEIGSLCVGPMADFLVVLTGLNDQNVRGTREFLSLVGVGHDPDLEARMPAESYQPKPVILVGSPVPIGEMAFKKQRREEIEREIGPLSHTLTYHPLLAFQETLFVKEYAEEYLSQEYRRIAESLLSLCHDAASDLLPDKLDIQDRTQRLAVLRGALRAAAQEPVSARVLLQQVVGSPSPDTDEEFILRDRACAVLGTDGSLGAVMIGVRGVLIDEWSQRSPGDIRLGVVRQERALDLIGESLSRRDLPIEAKAAVIDIRGATRTRRGDLEGAIADFSALLDMPDAPAEQQAAALFDRGIAHGKHGDVDGAIADYSALLDMPDAPEELRAKALLNRGGSLGKRGDVEGKITDYSALIDMPEAPAEQRAAALFNRGLALGKRGDLEGAIADYSAFIDMPDAPTEQRAMALFNRGLTLGKRGDVEGAIADWGALIDMPDAPIEQRALALFNRGVALGQRGDLEGAKAALDALINMPNAPIKQRAMALFNRGVALGQRGDLEGAIADYSALIDMPDAPAEQRAKALFNRGLALGQRGDVAGEIADYSAFIDMPDTPAEQRAEALLTRGLTLGKRGDVEGEIADYSALIDMPDAPAEQRSQAYSNLGWHEYSQGRLQESVAHSRAALELLPDQTWIRANLALALTCLGETKAGMAEYRRIAEETPDSTELERIAAQDLREALASRPDDTGLTEALSILEGEIARRREAADPDR